MRATHTRAPAPPPVEGSVVVAWVASLLAPLWARDLGEKQVNFFAFRALARASRTTWQGTMLARRCAPYFRQWLCAAARRGECRGGEGCESACATMGA